MIAVVPNDFDKLVGPKPKAKEESAPAPAALDGLPPARVAKEPVAPPSANEQQAIAKKLNEEFGLAGARTAAEKLGRAAALFQMNSRFDEQPNEQFVLLRKVTELAGDGGDAVLMLEAVDAMGARFGSMPWRPRIGC